MKRWMTVMLLALCLAVSGCGEDAGTEDETAVMLNGEKIGFREWNFYLRMNQMQWEKSYLDTYGDDMWSMEDGEDGMTLADSLKEEVLDTICQIHLTNQHADEYGVKLDEDTKQEIRQRAGEFMETYHEALLAYAGAEEEYVYEKLCERELSYLAAQASVADYEPDIPEETVRQEGICYVLISTTGLRDEEGNLTPFSDDEVARRTELAWELCGNARKSGSLKESAEAEGLTPIESSMGADNQYDGKEPKMLDAARLLEVGGISDPIQTEEGWFLVQHTSDYDEEGTQYWREYFTELAREEEYERIYEEWKEAAQIILFSDIMDQAEVKIVLKELL